MTTLNRLIGTLSLLCCLPLFMVACERQEEPVSFSRNVKPLLDQYCLDCHRTGEKGELASGFNMETYAGVMKGTRYGSMINVGDAQSSNMIILMEGRADPSISMPHGTEDQVSELETQIIRSWIDQGAKDN